MADKDSDHSFQSVRQSMSASVARYSKVFRPPVVTQEDALEAYKAEISVDDHLITMPELLKRYTTNLDKGLTNDFADELLRVNGPNMLHPAKKKSRFYLFIEHMFFGFATLLWLGVILSMVGFTISKMRDPDVDYDQVYLASVIFVVIMVTGLFGFYQESSNSSIMDSFKNMIPKQATVIRSGETRTITSEELVIGDIVKLAAGDCIPADIRIVAAVALKVDNSSITGESEPQMRSTETTDVNPLETANLAFYGTNVIEGAGKAVVIATGDDTLMGHIAGLTSRLQPEETPIKKELKKFIRIITAIAVGMGSIFFMLALIMEYDFFDAFIYFIAIIVANVPEGLLVTMTACLSLTARKMARKNCLCKNLHAIETLGSTTVICSDKTGTLTQNRMTVSHMYYDGSIIDVLSETYKRSTSAAFRDLCKIGTLCLRAEFEPHQDDVPISTRKVKGDASETAVLKCMETLVGDTAYMRARYKKIFEIPFNSSNKYQISIHKLPDNDIRCILVMKGAPERILDRCDTMFANDKVVSLNESLKRKIQMALLELGYMGERVLGFADLMLPPEYNDKFNFDAEKMNFPTRKLRFLGFMSMIDPPRPGVPDAVSKCKTAGIRVIMVTGDHPVTAMAIAKKVGIISKDNDTVYDIAMRKNLSLSKLTTEEQMRCNAAVITGSDLREYSEVELAEVIKKYNEIVFARTSPQQKLQIVEAFQAQAEVVAVTGDGVNDSPALKKADIGIAMGISGSDVSKEAADMIILDDNFASIVVGVEEGRLIFENLKKSISYMLTSNIPEMVPFMMHVLINIPLPLSVIAILAIDVGTDLWPGISLAYEMCESDIMDRPPRNNKTDRLVSLKLIMYTNLNIGIIQACAGLTVYFNIMALHGFLPDDLMGMRMLWYSEHNNVKDSYGQEWTAYERKVLEKKCYSGFFLAIVLTQIADCLICKTRRLSIFQQGMTNMVMNTGLIFEIVLGAVVVYCPYVNDVMRFEPISIETITPAIPFAFLIVLFDELRKYILRKRPGGWVDRETYY